MSLQRWVKAVRYTQIAWVNNSCDYDEDCIDNAFCLKQSHCECMDGRRPTKDRVTCVYTDKSATTLYSFNSNSAITQSDFLVALELDVHCFSYTLQLSKYLQSPNWDLSFALYQEYAVDK
uniref:EB domain-containing protein n=1 Tax=Timema genevievae TaxID=629358 RepID=A0A7R9JXK7_TIMGE|nr:unnamed protein product [Timema genevievae]